MCVLVHSLKRRSVNMSYLHAFIGGAKNVFWGQTKYGKVLKKEEEAITSQNCALHSFLILKGF